jgi:predicted ATPase
MLMSFEISGFKSYLQAKMKLSPLTVLIGANAAGKSNAIEGMRLLSWIAQGNKLNSIRYAVYEGDQAIRGTVSTLGHRVDHRGYASFRFSCDIDELEWDHYSIELEVGTDGDLHISDERITTPNSTVPLYEVVRIGGSAGRDVRVAYNNFARGGRKPQVTCSDDLAILHQLQGSARFEEGHRVAQATIPLVCRRFQRALSNILFFDPQPAQMRNYSFKVEQKLSSNGSNLSGVLYNLWQAGDSGLVLDMIRSLPEQNISGIGFIETPRGEVMVELEETFGGSVKKFDATLLSDGTLRVLSIAAAILSAPEGGVVVIEEIDNGIHPSRAREIIERINSIAQSRALRVVISSHNPALLDAVPDNAIPNIVFCYRDVNDGSSKLIALQDIPDFPELLAQGAVGHLMTKGLIDRFVKSHGTSPERRERNKAWLESMIARSGADDEMHTNN